MIRLKGNLDPRDSNSAGRPSDPWYIVLKMTAIQLHELEFIDKLPAISGLIVGTAFVALFAVFYADHQSALQENGVNPPVEVFIYHNIDPERKAQLESIESEIRERVSQMGFEAYAVNLNPQTETIEVVTDDLTKNDQVRALFSRHESEVLIELTNGDLGVADFGNGIFEPDHTGDELNDEIYQFSFKPL